MAPLIINRTNDALFKNIFANKKHKNITLSLINSVLEFEGTAQVQDIDFLDREVNGENDTDKDSRLDFLGVCSDGTKINVEIQVAKLEEMGRRSLFYWCRIYNDLEAGQDYGELKRTVAINLLDFNLFSKNDCPHYHNCYGLYNSKNYHKLTSDLEMYFIEIPKWKLDIMKKIDDKGKDKPQNIVDAEKVKAMKRLDKWVSYFSSKTKPEELEAIAMTEPMIQEALKAEVLFKQDKAAWWEYEKAEKIRRDKLAQINYAKKQGKVEDIKNLMDSCKWTVEQAMAALKIPKDDYPEYVALM